MSALPQQATLAGIAPVQTPALHALLGAGQPLKLTARGRLAADALVLDPDTHGVMRVQLLLRQHIEHHPHALPLLARLPVPELGSYALQRAWADRYARHLPAGTAVVVLGRGLETGTHAGQPVLRLLHTLGAQRADQLNPLHLTEPLPHDH